MVTIEDLTGIPEAKRNRIIACLDELLTFKQEGEISPVIVGYNFYSKLPEIDSSITISNIHETQAYKKDMLKGLEELGYDSTELLKFFRDKKGVFLQELSFRLRDNNGNLYPGLKIKNVRTGKYLDLTQLPANLENHPDFLNEEGQLIGEDDGWEINLPFKDKKELIDLLSLFLLKSSSQAYDSEGKLITETEEEKKIRYPWSDAYEVPVILVGRKALDFEGDLPHFKRATKLFLRENSNEISFVIHKNLDLLKRLPHYELLKRVGFDEEICLGNKAFIDRYVDKKR